MGNQSASLFTRAIYTRNLILKVRRYLKEYELNAIEHRLIFIGVYLYKSYKSYGVRRRHKLEQNEQNEQFFKRFFSAHLILLT